MSLAFVSKLLMPHMERCMVKKSCLFTFDTFNEMLENSWQIKHTTRTLGFSFCWPIFIFSRITVSSSLV